MSTDMYAVAEAGMAAIEPAFEMDSELHKRLYAALDCTSDAKIAARTGVTEKTVGRARKGVIGEVFMAKTIHTLRRHAPQLRAQGLEPPTLDDLFSVVLRQAT